MVPKKKIGIITFWESNDNYGQQLQCWALQHYLREKGYDAFLIRQYIFPHKKKGIKRIKQSIKNTLCLFLCTTGLAFNPSVYKYFAFCIDKDIYRRQFPLFRRKHLKMTRIYTPEELFKYPPEADMYITGSDQVWNCDTPLDLLKNYFLQFGYQNIKKISYAPSVGHTSFYEELKPIIKTYLLSFSAISVREVSAVSLLKELGYDAVNVLDPTMLLDIDDYLTLAKDSLRKRNVFIYSLNYGSKEDLPFEEIKNYAIDNELPVIVTTGSGYLPAKELFDGVTYCYATIPQWIQNIANAELVVTASFHGVVLSIIMHRPFLFTPISGTNSQSNSRIIDLLRELGIEDRIWNGTNCKTVFCNSISWDTVDFKLNTLKERSIKFLNSALT